MCQRCTLTLKTIRTGIKTDPFVNIALTFFKVVPSIFNIRPVFAREQILFRQTNQEL